MPPYRIDVPDPTDDALDHLVALGAIDVENTAGGIAALIPDSVSPEELRRVLRSAELTVSPAKARDDGSVWILSPRSVRVGNLLIVPAGAAAPDGSLQLRDGTAFGTGLHTSTALCLELLDELLKNEPTPSVLDIGAGSGVLALAALLKGAPEATAIDLDPEALQVAAENAQLNNMTARLRLVCGSAAEISGSWPLVLANILAASLMDMAQVVVRRVAHGGRLVLSGFPDSLAPDVERAYTHLGMRRIHSVSRGGWTALVLQASW
jgi:ribosomal protein L11 methyltransferase